MSSAIRVAFVSILTIWVGVAGAARGAIQLTVVDPDGVALEGVAVVLTSVEIQGFREEGITNAKGKARLPVPDMNLSYTVQLARDGLARSELTVDAAQGIVVEIVLRRAEISAVTAFNAGVEALHAGDLDAARVQFELAAERDPELEQAYSALAEIYLERGLFEQALGASERALRSNPQDERLLRIRHEATGRLGDPDATLTARRALGDVLGARGAAELAFMEGVEASRAREYEVAEARFREALELDPRYPGTHSALALAVFRRGRYEEAVRETGLALAEDPRDESALRVRYESKRHLGDRPGVIDALVGLALVDPQAGAPELVEEGKKHFDDIQIDVARAFFEKALEFDPDDALAHYMLGLCDVNQGDTASATKRLQRFLELAPQHEDATAARRLLAKLE